MPTGVTPELMTDWSWMTRELATMHPVFEPGTHNTYLSMVFGWLLGEVVRRTDPAGRTFGTFVRDELCAPLGMDSFYFGLPESERGRLAVLQCDDPAPSPERELVRRAVPAQVALVPTVFNRPDVQAGCIPAVGGIANASSVARFFALLAGRGEVSGTRLLSTDRVERCLKRRPDFDVDDETYGKKFPMGVGAFWLEAPGVTVPGGRILAHTGAGGSIGWADLDSGLSFAICHNSMTGRTPRRGYGRLAEAVRSFAAV